MRSAAVLIVFAVLSLSLALNISLVLKDIVSKFPPPCGVANAPR